MRPSSRTRITDFMVGPSDDTAVFDRALLVHKRLRAAPNFARYDFLHQWGKAQLRERLSEIRRTLETGVQIGMRGGKVREDLFGFDLQAALLPDCAADEEFLPIKEGALDLVISNLHMHSVNDLPGALIQIRRALKPDGLFMATLFGGETLYELRESLAAAEMSVKGGLSPRVFPFADKQQMGALMQRAGFALPVIDSDIIRVSYENIFKLMADLRGMGESNIISKRERRNPGKALFMSAAEHYAQNFSEEDGRITASFEVIFALGWAPHESQQKPLRPGSGETHLSEVL